MFGYIISLAKCREEDLIVTILCEKRVEKLYRFYGARHSVINLGFKVDFVKELDSVNSMGKLRNILHINYKWCFDFKKLQIWQHFIQLTEKHLRGVNELDSFYFELLDETAHKLERQDPKRSIIESYTKLLEHEGRLHNDYHCFICEEIIDKDLCLTRGFLPAHKTCVYKNSYDFKKIDDLFISKKSTLLDSNEIDSLWNIIMQGL
jgi:recombinational DNA repair protein (RecF pathway)